MHKQYNLLCTGNSLSLSLSLSPYQLMCELSSSWLWTVTARKGMFAPPTDKLHQHDIKPHIVITEVTKHSKSLHAMVHVMLLAKFKQTKNLFCIAIFPVLEQTI